MRAFTRRERWEQAMSEQVPVIAVKCSECGQGQLVALTRTEEFDFDLGDEIVKVRAENVPVTKCDKCGEGEMVEKAGKFGIFLACNRYPDCDYSTWTRPGSGPAAGPASDGDGTDGVAPSADGTVPLRARRASPRRRPRRSQPVSDRSHG